MRLIFLFFTTFYSITYGFINIESLRANSREGLNKSAKLGFNTQGGNTDKVIGSLSTLNSYIKESNEVLLIGGYRYGESFDEKDTEDGSVHLRYKKAFSKRHNIESYTQFEFNNFKALNFREVYGLGYRHEDKYFNTGLGAFYEEEDIDKRVNQYAIRGNFYVSGNRKTETGLEFSTILYLQPSFKQSNDLRVILNAGISQRVTKSLNLNIEYEYIYDERPPRDIKRYDYALVFGVSFI